MTRLMSASTTAAGRPGASKHRFVPRRRSYPSRTRNLQRQHRLALGGNTRSQKTLTQLNFVLSPHSDNEDESLQLFEGEAARDERSGGLPQKRKTTINHGKKKRRHEDSVRADRTLTQMVNVDWALRRPEAAIPEESNARHARKRRDTEMETIPEEAENTVSEDVLSGPSASSPKSESEARLEVPSGTSKSDRRKSKETGSESGQMLPPPNPITPRKHTRWIIPSSQSPESPEITLNSPRTPKSIRNSPVRWPPVSPTALLSPSPNKHRRSLLKFDVNDYDSQIVPGDGFLADDTAPESPTSVLSSPRAISDPSVSFKEDIKYRLNAAHIERIVQDHQTQEPNQQESIVYETDGELDPESLDDEAAQLPEINGTRKHGNPGDDQDAPQLVPESNDNQSSQNFPASTYISDTMSLCYTRQPTSYAFEKFHPPQHLSTNVKDVPESAQGTEVNESSQSNPLSSFYSDNQEMQSRSAALPIDKENSSVPQNDNEPDSGQQPSSPVVQVASSQRSEVEVPSSQTLATETEPRRIITCSQLLTESLMESIPGPPAWISGSHSNDLNDLNDYGSERP
ncbi:conserved hypothetical protein [Microsporum canis CBS 113480]|uniref:Uncharacterized protein n=1 Tax=Arthroderma otae (strain ATCC MYA-4605 / CBS 113480) TaxID=554155 RepID=C5FCW8_ARTOC|nr:conserved hypothetical protein [Microsporum canis CBS 113480]EEQ27652.1 conserved hypothetical protein [Microsporum canis CBS 113480]